MEPLLPLVLPIDGEMSIYRANELKELLMAAVASTAALDLDLQGVEEIDTVGIQLLLLTHREAAARKVALRLIHPSAPVRDALRCVGLDETLARLPAQETAA